MIYIAIGLFIFCFTSASILTIFYLRIREINKILARFEGLHAGQVNKFHQLIDGHNSNVGRLEDIEHTLNRKHDPRKPVPQKIDPWR